MHRGTGTGFRLHGRAGHPAAIRWSVLLVLPLLLSNPFGPSPSRAQQPGAGEVHEDTAARLTPEEWSQRLRRHTDDFATARLLHHEALVAIDRDDPERARGLLDEASTLDPRFDLAHRTRALLDLRALDPGAAGEVYEAAHDRFSGYRNQALALANLLLTLDTVLLVLLVWSAGVLLIRYLPFVHHRLSQWVLDSDHRKGRARLLWPAILAPVLGLLACGASFPGSPSPCR